MHLTSSTLEVPSAVSLAVSGSFTARATYEVVAVKGSNLSLYHLEDGRARELACQPVMATIRSLAPLRLAGTDTDFLVMTTDSGVLSILQAISLPNGQVSFVLVASGGMGRSGSRRSVAGHYLAVDPRGRCVIVGALEKHRLVFLTPRDNTEAHPSTTATGKSTISLTSPLEASQSDMITADLVALDVQYEHPLFAALEVDLTPLDTESSGATMASGTYQRLNYYEVDLGLNHIVKKASVVVSPSAHRLIPVPCSEKWPGGVLVCCENFISYHHPSMASSAAVAANAKEIRVAIPRRYSLSSSEGTLITAHTVHRQKDLFFVLLQSEFGDLYKAQLEMDQTGKVVTNLVVSVFDSLVPSTSLCITKNGLLYAANETGDHLVLQFQGLDDPVAVRSTAENLASIQAELTTSSGKTIGDDNASADLVAPKFVPSPRLRNLTIEQRIPSAAPLIDMLVLRNSSSQSTVEDSTPNIVTLCGRGNSGSLRTFRHGVAVQTIGEWPMQSKPTAIWTLRTSHSDVYDRLVVLSYAQSTVVLAVGDSLEEVSDSGLITTVATLQTALLADDAVVQITAQGIRHIRHSTTADGKPSFRVSDWKPPLNRPIQFAAANSRQVAIALVGGEIIYFELDEAGRLIEVATTNMGKDVSCLDLGVVPAGRQRSNFLAVGCWDDTVQLLTLDPSSVLVKGPVLATDSRPSTVCLVEMLDDALSVNGAVAESAALYLLVGLEKGVLMRVTVDPISGDLSDSRTKLVGHRPVRLHRVSVAGETPAVAALTSKAWLVYPFQYRTRTDPLSFPALDAVSDLRHPHHPTAYVGISGNSLVIFSIENLGTALHQTVVPLRYTPRRAALLLSGSASQTVSQLSPTAGTELIIVEASSSMYDVNALNAAEEKLLPEKNRLDAEAEARKVAIGTDAFEEEMDDEATLVPILPPRPPPSKPGTPEVWASCIRVIDTESGATRALVELQNGEAAMSVCSVQFAAHSDERFVVVGTVTGLVQQPTRRFSSAAIHVYRVLYNGTATTPSANGDGTYTLQLLHRTEVDEIPYAVAEFHGKLAVGAGKTLRLFELGKKKLLLKTAWRGPPTHIVRLSAVGTRLFVADASAGVCVLELQTAEQTFALLAEDTATRFITCMTPLDAHTVAVGDKFGSLAVLRVDPSTPLDALTSIAPPPRLGADGRVVSGPTSVSAATKLSVEAHFYVGDAPMGLALLPSQYSAASIVSGSSSTAAGTAGVAGNVGGGSSGSSAAVTNPFAACDRLLVATLRGGLTVLRPILHAREARLLSTTESFMRNEWSAVKNSENAGRPVHPSLNLAQRDHLRYRSLYAPVKNVIDLDICALLATLPRDRQSDLAEQLDINVADVLRRLEETSQFA